MLIQQHPWGTRSCGPLDAFAGHRQEGVGSERAEEAGPVAGMGLGV